MNNKELEQEASEFTESLLQLPSLAREYNEHDRNNEIREFYIKWMQSIPLSNLVRYYAKHKEGAGKEQSCCNRFDCDCEYVKQQGKTS